MNSLPSSRTAAPVSTSTAGRARHVVRPAAGSAFGTCELCGAGLETEHRHMLHATARRIVCACASCAGRAQARGPFRLIPREVRLLQDFSIGGGRWERLMLPIGLAFFFHDTLAGRTVALCPSPAGAVEAPMPRTLWNEIVGGYPPLRGMEPDVEALLVKRLGGEPCHYLVPIDVCYRLVGLVRLYWRGNSGGTEAWQEINRFFAALDAGAEAVTAAEEQYA